MNLGDSGTRALQAFHGTRKGNIVCFDRINGAGRDINPL